MRKYIRKWAESLGPRILGNEFSQEEQDWMKMNDVLAVFVNDDGIYTQGMRDQCLYFVTSRFMLDDQGMIFEDNVDLYGSIRPDLDPKHTARLNHRRYDFHPLTCDHPSIEFEIWKKDTDYELDIHETSGLILDMQDLRDKGFELSESENEVLEKVLEQWDLVLDELGKASLYYGLKFMKEEEIKRDFPELNDDAEILPKSKWPAVSYAEVIGNLMEDRNRHSMTQLGSQLLEASDHLEVQSQRLLMIRMLIKCFN